MAGASTDIGSVRETFFQNQVRVREKVKVSRKSDFCVDDKTFEVGGRGKGMKQIEGIRDEYVVKDDIEFGYGDILPLWHFGLMY